MGLARGMSRIRSSILGDMRDEILQALREHDAIRRETGIDQGLMTSEIAARLGASNDESLRAALFDLAKQGAIHQESFYWYIGEGAPVEPPDQAS
jgi:hypothetical protein